MDLNRLNRELNEKEIDYVYYHLAHHIKTDLSFNYIIGYHTTQQEDFKGIEIYKSNKGIDLKSTDVNSGLPLLFPGTEGENIFEIKGNKFIVKHDLIKASFYLLSGYQEYKCKDTDIYGRFKWKNSVQHKLNMTNKPLVNYYFEWLCDIIILYCKANNINYTKCNPLERATLHLTHDIDLLRYNSFDKVRYRWAQMLGLRRCDTDKKRLRTAAINSLLNYLKIKKQDNPYWSFGKIVNTERYYGYKSTWFFLPNNGEVFDADYAIEDQDVVDIANKLIAINNEIGLHISLNAKKRIRISKELKRLKKSIKSCSKISRAHFLKYNIDYSPREFAAAQIETDCTYGFSECEGYRNSYCFPFLPFDHKNQRIVHLVEIPLIMMDTTLLVHKKLSYEKIFEITEQLLEETRRFGGVFSLLWHNSTFDETYNPGILKFYEELHHFFSQYNLQCLTTSDITNKIHASIYE